MTTPTNQNRQALRRYLDSVRATRATGQAGELAYRTAFETLFIEFAPGTSRALQEPLNEVVGRPDFVIQRGGVPLGYVECKDIGADLEREQDSEQLTRYRKGLHNLILTDYLTFRWYVEGEFRGEARLAAQRQGGTLETATSGYQDVDLLLQQFLDADVSTVDTPQELARRMATKAGLLRESVRAVVEAESSNGRVFPLLQRYREMLVSDLNGDAFADMYAQTATYGLFAAWQNNPDGATFTRESAVFTQMTPFLRDTLGHVAGPRTSKELAWIIDDLARLLDHTSREAIMRGFGARPGQDDPIIHFFEDFLAAYDPKMRERRGVYYTPLPVVSYIVRSIDRLLRDEFNIADGLADTQRIGDGQSHRVTILDPAAGTGTFLREVIGNIRETITHKGEGGIWPQYVKDDLLPRLHGFELLMAPYTISHLSIAIALGGIEIGSDDINVVLTNSLEPPHDEASQSTFIGSESIEVESSRADEVKRDKPVMVILGNPPYSGHSANKGKWINNLLRGKDGESQTGSYFHMEGVPLGERTSKWINNDYVKFIRFAQWRIEQTGEGILGFITDNSYLDGVTFRGMRRSLMETFDDIYIVDLHGNANKAEKAADGGKDENVFDIRQGVAIVLLVKRSQPKGRLADVRLANLLGAREKKYEWLAEHDVDDTRWTTVPASAPQHLFVSRNEDHLDEYEEGWNVRDLFPTNSAGIVTANDSIVIQWTRKESDDVVIS